MHSYANTAASRTLAGVFCGKKATRKFLYFHFKHPLNSVQPKTLAFARWSFCRKISALCPSFLS